MNEAYSDVSSSKERYILKNHLLTRRFRYTNVYALAVPFIVSTGAANAQNILGQLIGATTLTPEEIEQADKNDDNVIDAGDFYIQLQDNAPATIAFRGTTGRAREGETFNVRFLFDRSYFGDIEWTIDGTAQSGTDYTDFGGSLTATGSSASIDIEFPDDGVREEQLKTLILTLSSSDDYLTGTPQVYTIFLEDNDRIWDGAVTQGLSRYNYEMEIIQNDGVLSGQIINEEGGTFEPGAYPLENLVLTETEFSADASPIFLPGEGLLFRKSIERILQFRANGEDETSLVDGDVIYGSADEQIVGAETGNEYLDRNIAGAFAMTLRPQSDTEILSPPSKNEVPVATSITALVERGGSTNTEAIKVRTLFSNRTPFDASSAGLTAISGDVNVSSDSIYTLRRSRIGQPASAVGGQQLIDLTDEVLEESCAQLYYVEAQESPGYSETDAAFRYKVLVYQKDLESGEIRPDYDLLPSLYDDPERARAASVEANLRQMLIANPLSTELHMKFLDLYYDRAVAEFQLANGKLEELDRLQLDLLAGDAPETIITEEKEIWLGEGGLLAIYRSVLNTYTQLLVDSMGQKVSSFSPEYPAGTPLGFYIFQNQVPNNPGLAAQYINDQDEIVDVPTSNPPASYPELYSGYRDLVMLFTVLRDYTDGLATGARILLLDADINNPEDENLIMAKELINEGYRKAYLDGQQLLGVFPDLDPANDLPDSGLASLIQSWEAGILELSNVQNILDGTTNPLGFQPDFLVLTTGFQGEGTFDSYNTLADWISELTDPAIRPLALAQSEFDRARTTYDAYEGFQDQLATELFNSQRNRDRRVRDLVGAIPGEPEYDPQNPSSGIIADQFFNIEQAREKIRLNGVEIDNVIRQIQIEIERRGREAGIKNAIAQVQVSYGEQRAGIQQEIAAIRADQAAAEAGSDAFENIFAAAVLGPGFVLAATAYGVFNLAVQSGGEASIGENEANLERLAAAESAEITSLENDLLGVNSQALIKNLYLKLNALRVESNQAFLTLRQEVVRLEDNYNELAQIQQFFADDQQFIAERYYADPIFYLRRQDAAQRANETFREAQDWVFYTARALEYKWNQSFSRTVGSRTWSIQELFKTRTTRELTQMVAAMELYDGAQSFGPGTGSNTDSLSFREDILGYRDLGEDNQPILYSDPITGELVRAKEAFRSYLEINTEVRDNGDEVVSLSFSTAFSPSGSQFFLPPEFDNGGNVITSGTWLDKIQWIKINIPGSVAQNGFINGFLADGGTQLMRNANVGTFDPANPDRIEDELTGYSSRIWFTQDGGETFEFRERLQAPIRLELGYPAGTTTIPDAPENTFFKERSVANTEWILEFTVFDANGAPGGLTLLSIDEVDDVEFIINHRFTPRL